MIDFAYPWVLLALPPYLALVIYAASRPKPSLVVSNVAPFKEVAGRIRLFRLVNLPFAIAAIAIAVLIVALARPRYGDEIIQRRAEGIDIMIAVDLSGSMNAIDVPRHITTERQLEQAYKDQSVRNRLEVAKAEIAAFIERRPNDRIGLISFGPKPYVTCPPTLDHAWLIAHLDNLEPGIIGDGTGIAAPIASATHRLKEAESKRRVLILFTDGSNNIEAKITPRQAAKLADKYNVTIYTVGIGSKRAYMLQNSFFGQRFMAYPGEFDEELLKDLSSTSKGRYYKADDAEGLEAAMKEIDKLEKTSAEEPRYIEYAEYAPKLIVMALAALILAFALEHTVCLRIP